MYISCSTAFLPQEVDLVSQKSPVHHITSVSHATYCDSWLNFPGLTSRSNLTRSKIESIQLWLKQTFENMDLKRLMTQTKFTNMGLNQLMTQTKVIDSWIDSWFSSESNTPHSAKPRRMWLHINVLIWGLNLIKICVQVLALAPIVCSFDICSGYPILGCHVTSHGSSEPWMNKHHFLNHCLSPGVGGPGILIPTSGTFLHNQFGVMMQLFTRYS